MSKATQPNGFEVFENAEKISDAKNISKKALKKETENNKKSILAKALKEDPTLEGRLRAWSNDVFVSKTLSYGSEGSVTSVKKVVDGVTTKDYLKTAPIVGYRIQNIGDHDIPYTTEVYAMDEDGNFVATDVKKILKPGECVNLTRKYMTLFAAMPEISNVFANGSMIAGTKINKCQTLQDYLNAHHFKFSDKKLNVNMDSVKINIADKVKIDNKETWKLKPEFEESFGYLNNLNSKDMAGVKKYDKKAYTAAYIRKLTAEKNSSVILNGSNDVNL